MKRTVVCLLLSVACAAGAACTGNQAAADVDASAVSCPSDLPRTCPSPPPTYSKDVQPAIMHLCVGCHASGGLAADRPLSTYDEVAPQKGDVLDQVYGCKMPPPDAGKPTTAERQALLGWLVCGARSD